MVATGSLLKKRLSLFSRLYLFIYLIFSDGFSKMLDIFLCNITYLSLILAQSER